MLKIGIAIYEHIKARILALVHGERPVMPDVSKISAVSPEASTEAHRREMLPRGRPEEDKALDFIEATLNWPQN